MNILLTGATGNLGSVVLRDLTNQNHTVITLGRTNPSEKSLTAPSNMDMISYVPADFNSLVATKESLTAVDFDSIDHIVLIHGVPTVTNILEVGEREIIEALNVNALSHFLIVQSAVKQWCTHSELNDKSITFISTVATETASPEEVPYHGAKAWMIQAMKSFARQFTSSHIRFNIISPGLMETDKSKMLAQHRSDMLDRIPLHRMVPLSEVSHLVQTVMFSKNIAGQNFHINSGRYNTL